MYFVNIQRKLSFSVPVDVHFIKYQGPDFLKILRQYYDNLRNFMRHTTILRQIYNSANFFEKF